jgi:hypothetical protein
MIKSELRTKRHELYLKIQSLPITNETIGQFAELMKEYNALCERWNSLILKES